MEITGDDRVCKIIKEGAIFIADSHYPHHSEEILTLLSNLPSTTPQLFLMGDIFDILFDHAPFLLEYNRKLIDLINTLSKQIEIFYFEGNHDFNLQTIFPKVEVYPLNQQPQTFMLNKQSFALSHGDRYVMGLGYALYTKIIRSRTLMRYLPFKQTLIDQQLNILKSKKICREFKYFEDRIDKIVKYYNSDMIVEGHYHQGIHYQNYISLPSLVCQKAVGVIEDNKLIFKTFDDML